MIELDVCYYYKGSTCTKLKVENMDFGHVKVSTDYGEFIGEYLNATELAKLILDLQNDVYA